MNVPDIVAPKLESHPITRYGPTKTSAVSLALRRWCFPFVAASIALFLLVGCSLSGSPTPTPLSAVPTSATVTRSMSGDVSPTRATPATPAGTPITPTNAASGEWVAAGTLGFGRAGHTATLLADGRMLVVGGEGGSAPLASVEQYDPQANRWVAAPSLGLARSGHTATLLPSGEVLIVGGVIAPSGAIGTTPTVELFDPVGGRWRGGSPLNQARSGQTATLLTNGRVLVVGGEALDSATGQTRLVASAELYDPASNSWSVVAPPARARLGHTATLLSDGRVLIAAGETSDANGQRQIGATAELFDVGNGSWVPTDDLSRARADATATLLMNGRVLVLGGRVPGGNTTAAAELFDPGRGIWSVASGLGTPRAEQTATRLLDGRVLVVGGYEREATTPTENAERYDPTSDNWTRLAAPPIARMGARATLLRDGTVLVVGGRTVSGRYAEAAERFVPLGLFPATPVPSATPRPPIAVPTAPATLTATTAITATVDDGPMPEPSAPVSPPVPTPTTRPPTQRPPTSTPAPARPTAAPTQAPAVPTSIAPATELPEPTASPPLLVIPTLAPPPATVVAPTVVAPTATPTVTITASPTAAPFTPTVTATLMPTLTPTTMPTLTSTPTMAATTAPARTWTIFGTIQFCAGQQCAPAVGAVVSTESGATRTDDGGVYALSGVAAGTVRVNVTYSPASGGTYTATQTVAVPANGRVQLNFTLQPAAQGVGDPTAAPGAPVAVDSGTENTSYRPTP